MFALVLLVNSCKKELYPLEKTDPKRKSEILAYKNGPKIEIINLAQFKNKVNLNALGTLKEQFVSTTPSKSNLMSIKTAETYLGFNIITDSIKVIKDKGHTMYIFPVALQSKRAVSFQNLTIDESAAGTVAFVNTYTPNKKWISEWKKGHPGKFDGNIKVNYLKLNNGTTNSGPNNKNNNQNTIAVTQTCTTTSYYFEIAYFCASGEHYPEDPGCTLIGNEAAGYAMYEAIITECVDVPEPGTGGTTPNPPPDYDPCPETPPVEEPPMVSGKKSMGNKIMAVPPTECDSIDIKDPEELLDEALDADAYLLIDCATASAFKALATHTPGQTVIDRISSLNANSSHSTLFTNPYFVQQMKNASGFLINLDRFEINVNTLPIIGGHRVSADEFLNHIRTNLNDFIDNSVATFEPYNDPSDGINDATRWNSSNPLGSILHLDMADNGSVIVSDYAQNHWTVSTLRTPLDGAHPVSGNRSWGYDVNSSGGYTFYVTGSDRLTRGSANILQLLTGIPFDAADQLWESFQSKVSTYVNGHAGTSTIGNKIKERPDHQSLMRYFNGSITLAQLKALKGCN